MAVQPSIRSESPHSSAGFATRELRALELYRNHGREIVRLGVDLYRVPSSDGRRSYDVLYGEREECPCRDFEFHGGPCKHVLAVGISVARRRGATVRALAALEERLRHELLDDEDRQELRDRVLALRRRLSERS